MRYKNVNLTSRTQKPDGTSRCLAQNENIKRQSLVKVDYSGVDTWGEAGQTTWYLVKDIPAHRLKGIICIGDVHLIIACGAKLEATGTDSMAGIQVSGEGNSLTIYRQPGPSDSTEADIPGVLIANGGKGGSAGIGGGVYDGSNITINGCIVTANGTGNSAGIGGGGAGSGFNITINGGTVTANSWSGGAGIGGGSDKSGHDITINGGIVTANGTRGGAGIGGGEEADGYNITINGGMVTANSGFGNFGSGAGIGGGAGSDGYNITINGGTVTAVGEVKNGAGVIFDSGGAGIGGGANGGDGSNITINGGEVTAIGGYLQGLFADGIGGGVDGGRTDIFVATTLSVKAGNTEKPTEEITNTGNDLASSLAGKQYVTIEELDLATYKTAAIDEIDAAIEGITDETILAVATKAKTDIGNATSVKEIDAIKTLALAKLTALCQILIARQGIQNAEINSMINDAVNGISNATTTDQITALHSQISTIIGLVQTGKAEALGEMGEPCTGCHAVKVKKGDTEIILYTPDEVQFIKTEAADE